MKFTQTPLAGVYVIDIESIVDERGFFARAWCAKEFEAHGLGTGIVQTNVSFNEKAGTLRGMHYQIAPHEEAKLVRCTAGAIYDVVIDLRPASATYKRHFAAELTAENHRMLYIPAGIAHGFQTLADRSEVFYQMEAFFAPQSARGVRWNDPAFGIEWPPATRRILSDRDANWPDFAG